jgi:hypothetical protein
MCGIRTTAGAILATLPVTITAAPITVTLPAFTTVLTLASMAVTRLAFTMALILVSVTAIPPVSITGWVMVGTAPLMDTMVGMDHIGIDMGSTSGSVVNHPKR